MKLLLRALAGALFACAFTANTAFAQVAISGNYYEEYAKVTCTSNSLSCFVVFTALPQNTLITDVSCQAGIQQIPYLSYLAVSDVANGSGITRRLNHFPMTQMILLNGNYSFETVFQTKFLFGAGKWPIIVLQFNAANNGFLHCKIVGTLQ